MNIVCGCVLENEMAAWCAIFSIWVMFSLSGWVCGWCFVVLGVRFLFVFVGCVCVDGCRAKAFSMFLSQAVCSCL